MDVSSAETKAPAPWSSRPCAFASGDRTAAQLGGSMPHSRLRLGVDGCAPEAVMRLPERSHGAPAASFGGAPACWRRAPEGVVA